MLIIGEKLTEAVKLGLALLSFFKPSSVTHRYTSFLIQAPVLRPRLVYKSGTTG